MLDMEAIRLIDDISIELRKELDLPIKRAENAEFKPIKYNDLVRLIQTKFEEIIIADNYHSDRSYVIKRKDEDDIQFYISVGLDMTSSKRIDSLMHEVAHVLLHKEYILFDSPRWKNSEPWEQEDEANCLSRAFLMPKDYFMYAIIKFSSNDGSVEINKIAKYFNVQERLVIERGRDLFVWN